MFFVNVKYGVNKGNERRKNVERTIKGIPNFGNSFHWINSSNVLCNYMKKQEYLDMILRNKAIIPRYVMEPVAYLDLGDIQKICFPMTCFCDIPFSKVNVHMSNYGSYGIAFDKKILIKKFRVQPIHYMNPHSPLTKDFREVFLEFYTTEIKLDKPANMLLNYLVSTLIYMKPIWEERKDTEKVSYNYVYQDECEWRYIPPDFPHDKLHFILKQSETTEIGKDKYSQVLADHKGCWMKFEWEDIRYIIVPDEEACRKTIDTIKGLTLSEIDRYILISKIEISKRFGENM